MSGLIQHSSESNEHVTPPDLVEASRGIMGRIDLDPASDPWFNQVIRAKRIYTIRDNGFTKLWSGTTFLNPPGGLCDMYGHRVLRATREKKATKTCPAMPALPDCRVDGRCGLPPDHEHPGTSSSMKLWWFKLVQEWMCKRVSCGVFIGFSIEVLQTTQNHVDALPGAINFPFCVPRTRLRFWHAKKGKLVEGRSPTHANAIIYLPSEFSEEEKRVFQAVFGAWGNCVWPESPVSR